MFDIKLPLRGFQVLFALISIGLNGYVAHWWDRITFVDIPNEINFMIFCSVWTFVIALFLGLAPLRFPSACPLIAILVLDALTMLFWFAGFIALAVFHGKSNGCYGRVCDDLVAAIVFGAFEWLLFVATTVLTALEFSRGGTTKTSSAPTNTV